MGLNYDFYETPQPKDGEQPPTYHARVVTQGTLTTDALANEIQQATSLTVGDVKAVLAALTQTMTYKLSESWRIHLEGLDYFQLTLSCPPVKSPREIRAESIHVKSIAFRPEIDFKNAFRSIQPVRTPVKKHSEQHSEQAMEKRLTAYFKDNMYMNGNQFMTLFGFTKSTAARRLKQLVAAGKLKKTGFCNQPLYQFNTE
ncbi:MAG: DNA-binding protein [Tannerella sp.]|jgi:predicted histone-like DNA-binding protein|nr:DNA-binding protein [Tannerella sp.]